MMRPRDVQGITALQAASHAMGLAALVFGLACSSASETLAPQPVAPQTASNPYQGYLVHEGIYVTFSQGIGEPALLRLLKDEGVGPLKSITIHGQRITARAVEAMMTAPTTALLKSLFLQGSSIGDSGLKAFAEAPRLAQIEHLNLQNVGATAAGVSALATSPHLKPKSLALGWQDIGDAGAQALAQASGVASLRLESAQIGSKGMVALLEGNGARFIQLISNPGGLTGLRKVSPRIQSLLLDDCHLKHADIQALTRAQAPSLTSLDISRSNLLDDSLKAIMAAPWFHQLDTLSLGAQRASAGMRRAFIKAYRGSFLSIYRKDL